MIIEECKNSALRKNTNDALLENDKLLMTDGGVAYYFNVKLNQNGVIVESILEKVKVTINLKDVGLEVENGAVAQIAKYNGNKSVTLTPATILNDCVTFEISELGQYALCLEGYATQNESRLATFFTKYKGYMLLALIGIFLIVAPIQYNRKMKRRKLKQEKLAYGRYRKEERKKKRKTNHIKK